MSPTRMSAHEMSIGRSASASAGPAFFAFTFFSVLNGLPSSPLAGEAVSPAESASPFPLAAASLGEAGGGGAVIVPARICASSSSTAARVRAYAPSESRSLASIADASSAESIELREGLSATSSSPAKRGMTWKCAWKTTCPASLPLLLTMFTAGAPVAACTSRESFGRSDKTFAATCAGMSVIEAHACFGRRREWPGVTGNASRMARECSVSKILWLGISPRMIFAKMF
mmetsp:Transcript_6344/g.15979  ORF Transcript_6344/g.15979 Transcript_6344/m.15979 type:complete len:230 (-) Transcript_6344:29-718(-)